MKPRWIRSSTPPGAATDSRRKSRGLRWRARGGLTLTEVVAGLVLLTTVLASVFVARGRFLQQWADADRKLQALRAADELLARWLSGPRDQVPLNTGGTLEGVDGCRWTTRELKDPDAERLESNVVRLEVTHASGKGIDRTAQFVVAIEFLLPAEQAAVSQEADR